MYFNLLVFLRTILVFSIFSIFLVFCLGVQPAAASALPLPEWPTHANGGRIDLAAYAGLVEDPSNHLTVNEVRQRFQANDITPAPESGINLGYSHSAWWIGFWLPPQNAPRNTKEVQRYLLELGFSTVDYIEYYSPHSTTAVITGDLFPFSQRPVVHRNFVFPLEPEQLGTAPSLVLFKVQSEGTLSVPLVLWKPSHFASYNQSSYAGLALYFGIILALLFYNILLWISIREQMYFDYVLFVAGLVIGLGGLHGLGNQFIWGDWPWFANLAFPIGFCLCTFGVAQFTRSFLSLRLLSPKLDNLLLGFAISAGVVAIIAAGFSYMLGSKILTILAISTILLAVFAGVYSLFYRVMMARLFLLAWSLFMLFGVAFSLRNYGVIPTNFWTLHGLQLGSIIGMLLLSFALANRIQDERRAKEAAQAEAIKAKQINIEQLQRSERELEYRVTERTTELKSANLRLRESEQHHRELAHHDMLTGLANRVLFNNRIEQAMEIAQRDATCFALLYLDLDKFKPVNDTYGHAVGDLLLKVVASRMIHLVRESDTVARIGGDEFVVILRTIKNPPNALLIADAIRNALSREFTIEGLVLHISCSIGIAIYPDHGSDEVALSRVADDAMYQAKRAGRNIVYLAQV